MYAFHIRWLQLWNGIDNAGRRSSRWHTWWQMVAPVGNIALQHVYIVGTNAGNMVSRCSGHVSGCLRSCRWSRGSRPFKHDRKVGARHCDWQTRNHHLHGQPILCSLYITLYRFLIIIKHFQLSCSKSYLQVTCATTTRGNLSSTFWVLSHFCGSYLGSHLSQIIQPDQDLHRSESEKCSDKRPSAAFHDPGSNTFLWFASWAVLLFSQSLLPMLVSRGQELIQLFFFPSTYIPLYRCLNNIA